MGMREAHKQAKASQGQQVKSPHYIALEGNSGNQTKQATA